MSAAPTSPLPPPLPLVLSTPLPFPSLTSHTLGFLPPIAPCTHPTLLTALPCCRSPSRRRPLLSSFHLCSQPIQPSLYPSLQPLSLLLDQSVPFTRLYLSVRTPISLFSFDRAVPFPLCHMLASQSHTDPFRVLQSEGTTCLRALRNQIWTASLRFALLLSPLQPRPLDIMPLFTHLRAPAPAASSSSSPSSYLSSWTHPLPPARTFSATPSSRAAAIPPAAVPAAAAPSPPPPAAYAPSIPSTVGSLRVSPALPHLVRRVHALIADLLLQPRRPTSTFTGGVVGLLLGVSLASLYASSRLLSDYQKASAALLASVHELEDATLQVRSFRSLSRSRGDLS